jgi:hypothetical protein
VQEEIAADKGVADSGSAEENKTRGSTHERGKKNHTEFDHGQLQLIIVMTPPTTSKKVS